MSLSKQYIQSSCSPGVMPFGAGPSGLIIPADRRTTWQPGVTYNTIPGSSVSGIPTGGTIFNSGGYSPSGGDDTANIATLLDNASLVASVNNRQIVLLNAGSFSINGNGINPAGGFVWSYVTLRGAGPGTGGLFGTINNTSYTCTFNPQGTGTFLNKTDRATNGVQVFAVGSNFNPGGGGTFAASANLTADAVKETTSCIIQGNPGLTVGQPVLIDILTDVDPNTFWGARNEDAGCLFVADTGGVSSTTINVTSVSRGRLWWGNYTDNNTGADASTFTYQTAGTTSQTFLTGAGTGTGLTGTYTVNNAVTFSNQLCYAGLGSRRGDLGAARQDRSISQIMNVTSFTNNGNGTFTVNFETPFHYNFPVSLQAQLTPYQQSWTIGFGLEGIYFFGGRNGDGGGNIFMAQCAYSWIKNCESHYSQGSGINIIACYRSELRDSYMHESPNPNPGGDGYLCGINNGTADCLIENNIMINGDKNIVARTTGGGNVIAYNYMDDAFGQGFPDAPEAGVNAGHFCGPHMELIEGNYSHNFKGDSFWGSSTYITGHRNWISTKRAAHGPLATYTYSGGPTPKAYGDYDGVIGIDIQAGSYNCNLTGNVIGFSGQTLLSEPNGSDPPQDQFVYEVVNGFSTAINGYIMWQMGFNTSTNAAAHGTQANTFDPTTYQTQLRMGNWDWFTQTQKWHGIGGTQSTSVTPVAMPNSFYLNAMPAFWQTAAAVSNGVTVWPWVDPSNGSTAKLPAKARFDAGTPNVI